MSLLDSPESLIEPKDEILNGSPDSPDIMPSSTSDSHETIEVVNEDAKSESSRSLSPGKRSYNNRRRSSSPNNDTPNSAKVPKNPLLVERCNCDELRHVICHLETKELWDKFHELGTEMIITKSGR